MEGIAHARIAPLFTLLVTTTPTFPGIAFAFRPNQHRLTLMRPLALAAIFAAVSNLSLWLANAFQAFATQREANGSIIQFAPAGLFEAAIVLFVGLACLTVAWLCVAIGIRK